jgi:hypothetical protein
VAVLAILVALMGGVAGWCMRGGEKQPLPVADTVVITTTDTVTLVGPRDTLVRIAWKPYPVAVHDTTFVIRHTTDSIFVMLPYEHRHLHRPDTLDVWYSGVDARIDSATVYYQHTTEIVHHLPDVRKMPRLTAGVGCGAIYQEKRVNAYLFGEMRYNAPKTTFGTFAAIDPTGQWCAGASVSYRFDLIR